LIRNAEKNNELPHRFRALLHGSYGAFDINVYCGPDLRQPAAFIQAANGSSMMFALATESWSALT
jgi:hypothetical protein